MIKNKFNRKLSYVSGDIRFPKANNRVGTCTYACYTGVLSTCASCA